MAKKLYGTDPDQVPTNADLGTIAYQDKDNVHLTGRVMVSAVNPAPFTVPNASESLEINDGSTTKLLMYADNSNAYIQASKYDGTNPGRTLIFATKQGTDGIAAESARFNVSGNLAFPSGQGIDFSATGDGSGTMTSELLDDYEEGLWTPAFTYSSSTTGLSITYANQTGYYTKIGNIVYYSCDVRITSFTKGSASGTLQLEGFPFASKNNANYARPNTVPNLYQWPYQTTAGFQPMFGMFQDGATKGDFSMMRSNNASTALSDPDGDSMLFLAGWYYAA